MPIAWQILHMLHLKLVLTTYIIEKCGLLGAQIVGQSSGHTF